MALKTGKKILIVEDFTDVRKMMGIMLKLNGYDVVEAEDGYEGIEKAVSETPDLILMDIAMPLLDGIQATAVIRTHASLDKVPILAITAYDDIYKEDAMNAGCTEILRKPVGFAQLRPIIERYLN